MEDYSKVLADNILKYRKEGGFTQDALAEKMGVSFQTVSKWETGASCPDVVRLPELADIFGITLDELFGREVEEHLKETEIEVSPVAVQSELPWPNDDTIRAAVFKGHKLLEDYEDMSQFTFCFDGEAMNVVSYCNIECESIEGNVTVSGDLNASGDINVEGNLYVGGEATAGGDINVEGDFRVECESVQNGATAGGDVNVGGDLRGTTTAGGDINVDGDVYGTVNSNGDVNVDGDISGNVQSGGDINCETGKGKKWWR